MLLSVTSKTKSLPKDKNKDSIGLMDAKNPVLKTESKLLPSVKTSVEEIGVKLSET